MTVPTSDNREQYQGNDSATEFDYAFKIFRADDLVVVLTASDGTETTLTRGTDYSVDGVGEEVGGTVTYPLNGDPLATGETLTILREIPVVQETDLRNQGAYYPETLEDEFDRSRMIDQQQQEHLGRTLSRTRASDYFDAKGRRIANVGDAVEDQDAYTKGQADARFDNDVITKTGGHWDAKGLQLRSLQTRQPPSSTDAMNFGAVSKHLSDVLNEADPQVDGWQRVRWVNTIADLLGLDTSELVDGQQVQVKEYHAGTGVGGGLFYYDATSTSEPDEILVFGSGAQGRFKRSGVERVSALMAGARRDGVSNDSPYLSKLMAMMDEAQIASAYIPNSQGTYLLSETVTIKEPGCRLFGDRGPTYERGLGRPGNFLIDSSLDVGFDFGAYRTSATTTNVSDEWTVEGIGFIPGRTDRTQTAMTFSVQRNGPDRGVRLSKVSSRGMDTFFHVLPMNPNVSTSIANLCVENCNLSNNRRGIVSEGNVLGLRFVNNQAEQLTGPAISGGFSSGITITDNMLEGTQVDGGGTIDLEDSRIGNRLMVNVENNYFESNSGLFLMRFRNSAPAYGFLNIGPNYKLNNTVTNEVVVDGGWATTSFANMVPTFTGTGGVVTLPANIRHFFDGSGDVRFHKIATKDLGKFIRKAEGSGWLAAESLGTSSLLTPFGIKAGCRQFEDNSGYINFNVDSPLMSGDLVYYSMLIRKTTNGVSAAIRMMDSAYQNISNGATNLFSSSVYTTGEWYLVVGCMRASSDYPDTTVRLDVHDSQAKGDIASMAIRVERGRAHNVTLENPLRVEPIIVEWE